MVLVQKRGEKNKTAQSAAQISAFLRVAAPRRERERDTHTAGTMSTLALIQSAAGAPYETLTTNRIYTSSPSLSDILPIIIVIMYRHVRSCLTRYNNSPFICNVLHVPICSGHHASVSIGFFICLSRSHDALHWPVSMFTFHTQTNTDCITYHHIIYNI